MQAGENSHYRPHESRNGQFSNGHAGALTLSAHPHATVELLKYWLILRRHKILICGVTVIAMVLTGIYYKYYATPLYRAEATITPVPPSQDMASAASPMLDNLMGGGGSLSELLMGGDTDNELVSQRYIAVMTSFDFTMSLARHYHLVTKLLVHKGKDAAKMTPWNVYKAISGNFDTDYDFKSGNLQLTYVNADPDLAREVLTDYLDALREKLRNQEMQGAAVAAKSLQAEIGQTSDSLLQAQLYELMAHQIQREKLAQLQADFAFKMVDPPMVPGMRYWPHPVRFTILAGVATLFLLSMFFVMREWIRHAHAHLKALEAIIPLTEPVYS
ncbi:MAG: Wzz/FepE/Etk N-terminal domain-containing protein, partial [Candidatus Binataceae bacterium]